MRLLIALGGNALLKRGEPMTAQNQRANVRTACEQIAKAYEGNELIISHGNGPQVGLLALQNNAYKAVPMYPLDVIGAESLGMIGYMIQQELANFVPKSATLCNVLTQTEVDPKDPAFQHPTKPVGPVYTKEEAEALAAKEGWSIAPDNDKFRRVVPSPEPKRIFGLKSLKTLVEAGHIVICCGGGGIPTYYDEEGRLRGAAHVSAVHVDPRQPRLRYVYQRVGRIFACQTFGGNGTLAAYGRDAPHAARQHRRHRDCRQKGNFSDVHSNRF